MYTKYRMLSFSLLAAVLAGDKMGRLGRGLPIRSKWLALVVLLTDYSVDKYWLLPLYRIDRPARYLPDLPI